MLLNIQFQNNKSMYIINYNIYSFQNFLCMHIMYKKVYIEKRKQQALQNLMQHLKSTINLLSVKRMFASIQRE